MEIEQLSIKWLLSQGRNKDIKDVPEFNENECTTYPDLWNTREVVLKGKFIVLCAYTKEIGKMSH